MAKAKKAKGISAKAETENILSMQEAIELLKTTRATFYRWLKAGEITGMKVGRQWRFTKEEIERFMRGEAPAFSLDVNLTPLFEALVAKCAEQDVRIPSSKTAFKQASDSEKVEMVAGLLIRLGAGLQASDIHLERFTEEVGKQPAGVIRYRVSCSLVEGARVEGDLLTPVVDHLKEMCAMNTEERNVPQDGRTNLSMQNVMYDLRISTAPTVTGEEATVRLLNPDQVLAVDLDRAITNETQRETLRSALRKKRGMVVFTGTSGSGKTTTLYASIKELSGPATKIMTIEDPIEFLLPNVTQMRVTPEGMDIARGLKVMLRSAVDVMVAHELRNSEAIEVAWYAATTGHLVMSQMHCPDAITALLRIREMSDQPFLEDAISLIVGQRLVRKSCSDCRVAESSPEAAHQLEPMANEGGLKWHSMNRSFARSKGCTTCKGTGVRGRLAINEMLVITPDLAQALRRGATAEELCTIAIGEGFVTLGAEAARLASDGIITCQEAIQAVN